MSVCLHQDDSRVCRSTGRILRCSDTCDHILRLLPNTRLYRHSCIHQRSVDIRLYSNTRNLQDSLCSRAHNTSCHLHTRLYRCRSCGRRPAGILGYSCTRVHWLNVRSDENNRRYYDHSCLQSPSQYDSTACHQHPTHRRRDTHT